MQKLFWIALPGIFDSKILFTLVNYAKSFLANKTILKIYQILTNEIVKYTCYSKQKFKMSHYVALAKVACIVCQERNCFIV